MKADRRQLIADSLHMTTFTAFRKIAFIEGISYLVLLFIAMPLKYMANQPMPVTIVGYIHGALFVAMAILAYMVMDKHNKKFTWFLKAGVASIVPFGTFYMDKEWKREETVLSSK